VARGLQSLSVQNFQILGDVTVELGRLNVLVGPNGSGKSTLLRVVQFLGDAARSGLSSAIAGHGGVHSVWTRREKLSSIAINVKALLTTYASRGAPDEYSLAVLPFNERRFPHRGYDRFAAIASEIYPEMIHRSEQLSFKRTARAGRRITLEHNKLHFADDAKKPLELKVDDQALALSLVPQLGPDRGGAEVRKIQELFTTFRVFDINAAAARAASEIANASSLRADAGNLAAFLTRLQRDVPDVFSELCADARAMVPGLKDLKLRPIGGADESVAVEIVDDRLPGATPLSHASFGTVRALSLLAMLHDPAPPLLTCVEEIDHGLHPHVFDRLVDLLRAASARTQFLIATHSPALVNRLEPSELIVCERDPKTGLARIPAIDSEEVVAMRQDSDYGLGELWFSGSLGGVPK
jgi:predicted ATPase